ncbi:MAG: pilus assembly protein [Bdellovibrionales bacterium]
MNPFGFKIWRMIPVALLLVAPLFAHAADDDKVGIEADEVGETAEEAQTPSYVNLAVGIYYDEKLGDVPNEIELGGVFRKFTRVQWNPKTKTLRFNPHTPGIGTLIIKHPRTGKILAEYTLDVRKTDLQKTAREIQALLQGIEGVQVRILNNKVVVDGQILLPADMKRIHSVVKQYAPQATSLVTLSPIATNKIAQFIERKIGNPEIRVNAVNGKFILEGFANSREEKDKAEIVAKMYVPDVVVDEAVADKKVLERKVDVVINMILLRPPPEAEPPKIVQMVVHYVELQKDYTKSFRFQWLPDIGDGSSVQFQTGGRNPGGLIATLTGTISNLIPKLNWAKQHGFARVLQSSSVTVEDSKPGVINSITRLPYQVVNAQGQPSTNFEETGIRTNITPQIMGARSDSVKLALNFAVKSLLSYSDQGPLTASREIQTVLHVRSGQSAAVGGLITNDSGTNFNKLPAGASRNPIISLYASKDFRRNQSQFVVFVTPLIKSSASAGADKIKKKFRLDQN